MNALRRIGIVVLLLYPVAGAHDAIHTPWFPARSIELIVPFAAGGGLDRSSRLLAKYAEKELGERITVVNRTAGGNLRGNLEGIRAEPDGYVLGVWGMGLVTDELVIRNAPYTHRDVQPLCMYARDPHILCVGKSFAETNGIRDFDDFVRYVKANPERVTYGSGGNWTSHDFVRIKLEEEFGLKFVRMPFLGGGPAARALAVGNCDVASPFIPEYLGVGDTDDLLPLLVTYETRLPQLPDVPSCVEAGHPGLQQSMWRVLTVPKNTPGNIVQRLAEVFEEAVHDPGFVADARVIGVNPAFMGPRELADFLEKEYAYFFEKTGEWGIRIDRD